MATNPFFNNSGTKSERSLQENLFIEFVQIKGMDVIYLPKVYLASDTIMNEVINHYHSRGMMIEMLLENYEDWENNGMDFNQLGMQQLANEAQFAVSRRRFREEIDAERLTFGDRPNEGDIIWCPDLQEMFKIKKVNVPDPTKGNDRWILKCDKYDADEDVSIDTFDYMEEAGIFDTDFENNSAYIPLTDEVSDFLGTSDDDSYVEPRPDQTPEEYDAELSAKRLSDINKENPNQLFADIGSEIIEE